MSDLTEVIVGVVGRAHGIRGDVHVDVRTDEPGRRFTPGSGLRLSCGQVLQVERVRWDRGRLIVAFRGHPDRTAVEKLRGERLLVDVPVDELPSEPEEYFDRQLVGLQVRDAAGHGVGTITEVLHLPAQDCLSVRTSHGDALVPFVKELVPVVDLTEGFVQVADIEGLLEQG
ncbi:ribosome maturation factor RimM [Arachnia propionica]|uniref:Ribosome maturation factor RimM n=1 Tax=Arachnia propionica TaxID=1750 RepID=A0A3P1T374_9ACTN|nr:ribosome maturation factor RimM [Arachnia propionica]MDO5083167.1 ribosome maturation factor RimM [Arachnia propionica]RRD03942.1 ribosome maturation factor RimM [Arachnia propionica]